MYLVVLEYWVVDIEGEVLYFYWVVVVDVGFDEVFVV